MERWFWDPGHWASKDSWEMGNKKISTTNDPILTALGQFPNCVQVGIIQAELGGASELGRWSWEPRKTKVARSWERVRENRADRDKSPDIYGGPCLVFSWALTSTWIEDTIQGRWRKPLTGLVGTTLMLTRVQPQCVFLLSRMENLIIHGHHGENSGLATEVGKFAPGRCCSNPV